MGKKKSKKKIKKRILIVAALVLLVSAASYTVFIAPLLETEEWVYIEDAVERGTLKVGVTESGSLEYGSKSIDYDLDLEFTSQEEEDEDEEETTLKYLTIEEIYVAAGQRITEGESLVKFTEDSVQAVRRLLQSALVDAQTAYNEAESEYDLSALEAQMDYESQKLTQQYAASIYQNATTAAVNDITAMQLEIQQRSANIASLEERVTEAQEDYAEAEETYQAAKADRDNADKSNADSYSTILNTYINAVTRYENAKSSLTQAQQKLEDNAAQITVLQTQLTAAQARLKLDQLETEETYREALINGENAEITYTAQLESLKETLEEAKEEKELLEEQMEAFETFVGEDGILYASEAGIVTEVRYETGDRLTESGTILSYTPPESMTLSVDVTQEDVVDLSVGDTVDITFTAYEDTSYAGTILSIDTTATARDTNTISYTVVIGVDGDTEKLYGGMTADIIFVTEEKEDVLYVSRKAIVEESGKTYVYVSGSLGQMELREVETGITNGVDVEILSGLEEGETIYLASRVSSEAEVTEGSTSQESTGSDAGNAGDSGATELPDGMELPEGMGDMVVPDNTGGQMQGGFGGERPSGGNFGGRE